MNAKTQYKLSGTDLELLLAVVRGGTLATAGERLGLDTSTVFRSVQRIERGIGQRLFERSRFGYLPSELTQMLVSHAEQMEVELESARSAAQLLPDDVSGSVRITTTDTILHGLVAPSLKNLSEKHPLLSYDLHTGNEALNLSRRDADIAVRATKRAPQHLVGKHIGPIRVALYASSKSDLSSIDDVIATQAAWIAPDEAIPDHPSVIWRKKHFPKVSPVYRVSSILTAAELVLQNFGVAILPLFLLRDRPDARQLTDVLDDCQTELWLLTHPESRHLRRVATVFRHLSQSLAL